MNVKRHKEQKNIDDYDYICLPFLPYEVVKLDYAYAKKMAHLQVIDFLSTPVHQIPTIVQPTESSG